MQSKTNRRTRRTKRGVTALAFVATLALVGPAVASTFTATPALAAPGDPFPAADPIVFLAQDNPTQLYRVITDSEGVTVFQPEGPAAPMAYNSIAYNPADNYIYAITNTTGGGIPIRSLVRIGEDGLVTQVGTADFAPTSRGTFGPPDGLFYTYTDTLATPRLQVIDVTTGLLSHVVPLTGDAIVGVDFTYAGGYLWGADAEFISRTDPATGATTRFPNTFAVGADPTDGAGANWTYGNGNLGFAFNGSGTIYQVAITDPGSVAPGFELISATPGPASGNNDGTASPGLPTDLSIIKTGPAALIAGGTVTYELTVTNNGAGNSSGHVVDDTIPAPLTNVTSPDDACTVTGNVVQCIGDALANGESVTYTISASVPADLASTVSNTATVTSHEEDPVTENNTSTHDADPARILLLKSAGTPVDVNGNGITDAGDTIQYTFDVTNTGLTNLTAVSIEDPLAGAVSCPQPGLVAGETITCAADEVYTITEDDVTAGSVDNSATVTATTIDDEEITSTSTTTTPTTAPAPAISLVKSTDAAGYSAGQTVSYRFLVANSGNVPLSNVTVVEEEFSGTGTLSEVTCPASTLAVDAQMVCTAEYTATAADEATGSVTNSAVAEGLPAGEASVVTSASSVVSVVVAPAALLPVLGGGPAQPAIVAIIGLLLLLAGAAFVVIRRRTRSAS